MSLPVVFHPAVHADVDDAYRWYEQQRTGLGDDFLAAIEELFQRISQMPKMQQVVYRDVRRGLPRRFPYGVFYKVHPDRVEVIAVYHCSRDPIGWQARA
jgi:plasmid stabilization system protein ParE